MFSIASPGFNGVNATEGWSTILTGSITRTVMRKLCGCTGILMRKGLSDYRVLSSLTSTFTCGKLHLGIINVGVGASGYSLYASNTNSERFAKFNHPKDIWLSGFQVSTCI